MELSIDYIKELINKANETMFELFPDYEYPNIVDIKLTDSLSYWGCIVYCESTGTYKLRISKAKIKYFKNKKDAETKLLTTIYHELIHTMPGCMNHGCRFLASAEIINEALNLNIQPITKTDSSYDRDAFIMNESKYALKCPNCGYLYPYRKMCKAVKNPENFSCIHCGHTELVRIK